MTTTVPERMASLQSAIDNLQGNLSMIEIAVNGDDSDTRLAVYNAQDALTKAAEAIFDAEAYWLVGIEPALKREQIQVTISDGKGVI